METADLTILSSRDLEAAGWGTDVNMSDTTIEDETELQRRNMNSLAAAFAVGMLCLLGIVLIQLARRFMGAITHRHTDKA